MAGITLIEVTVSIALLAIAGVCLLGAFFSSLQLDTLNREQTWARQECRRQIEGVLAMPFTTVASLHNTTFDVACPVNGLTTAKQKLKATSGASKVGRILVDSTAAADSKCYKVTITATWRTGNGKVVAGAYQEEKAELKFTIDVGEGL